MWHQNCSFHIRANLAKLTYKKPYWSSVILGCVRAVYGRSFEFWQGEQKEPTFLLFFIISCQKLSWSIVGHITRHVKTAGIFVKSVSTDVGLNSSEIEMMFKFFRVLIMFRRTIWVSACYSLFQIIQISVSCPYFCWFTLSCSVLVVPHRRFISTDTLALCPCWVSSLRWYTCAVTALICGGCVRADTHVLCLCGYAGAS